MALFDNFKERVNGLAQQAADLAQVGASKSRQLASVAKLKAANLGEEDAIRKAYQELGKLYFAKYGEHPEDEFAAACSTIIEAQAAIVANNAQIEELTAVTEVPAEEAPAEEPAPEEAAAEEASAEEAAPAEEAPAEESAPAEEEAPAEEPAPEEAPAEESAPAEEAAPAGEEAPVQE